MVNGGKRIASNGTNPQVTDLQKRVFDYTSNVLGLQNDWTLQDPPISIRYVENPISIFRAAYDGQCAGGSYESCEIATMTMYCHTAEKGGSALFNNSGVRVEPTKGSAVCSTVSVPYVYCSHRMVKLR